MGDKVKDLAAEVMIYDCFTFFNELDLLELRLNILDKYVDRFVICEGDRTFRGQPKPLYFRQNRHRFERWRDRIIYLKAPLPSVITNPWRLEEFQRNWIATGLTDMLAGDLIFISDIDEVWDPRKLEEIEQHSFREPVKMEQRLFYYKLNLEVELDWYGTVAVRGFDFKAPQWHRTMGNEPHISNAGWHFSYLGNSNDIANKIKSFSHSELDTPEYTNVNHIEDSIMRGKDLFNRNLDIKRVEIDNSYPEYIVENVSRLGHLLAP